MQLAVDEFIPPALFLIHIFQFGQYYLIGFVQRVKNNDLVAVCVADLLGTKIRVDQKQGFRRQGFQLQIPGGVVGGNVADPVHLTGKEPLVGVIVVQVGNPLAGAAAEFSKIVGCGGSGNQGQVHLHPRLLQPAGGGHGNVVDAGDMA